MEFLNKLALISTSIKNDKYCSVYVIGDMNVDITDKNSTFAKHMDHFCTDNTFILCSGELLSAESYTLISEAWHTTL